jgi:hypothetical protein
MVKTDQFYHHLSYFLFTGGQHYLLYYTTKKVENNCGHHFYYSCNGKGKIMYSVGLHPMLGAEVANFFYR